VESSRPAYDYDKFGNKLIRDGFYCSSLFDGCIMRVVAPLGDSNFCLRACCSNVNMGFDLSSIYSGC